MSTSPGENYQQLAHANVRRATRWYCGSLIALLSGIYILLTEAAPIDSSTFAGAIPGSRFLPWAAVVQLALVAFAQGMRAKSIRSAGQAGSRAPQLLCLVAHVSIVIIAAIALTRGPASGTLIAGFDDLLAAILTTAAVSTLLHLLELRTAGGKNGSTFSWLEGIASAAFAVACLMTEFGP